MKIRNLLLVAAFAGLGFTSCDLEDLGTTVSTDLDVDIPLVADTSTNKSANIDSLFVFVGKGEMNLKDNEDVKKNLDNLNGIDAEDGTFVITGLDDGTEIYWLSLNATISLGDKSFDFDLLKIDFKGLSNGDPVALESAHITKLNEAFAKWEELGFEESVISFNVSGGANTDLGLMTVAPNVDVTIGTLLAIGL